MKDLIDRAKKKASQSPIKYKISAIGLDFKGDIVGSAFNSLRFNCYGGGIHADMEWVEINKDEMILSKNIESKNDVETLKQQVKDIQKALNTCRDALRKLA